MKQVHKHQSENQNDVCKVYIIKETGGELVIVKVQPEQEAAFLEQHVDKVIVSSYSVAGAIMQVNRYRLS